MEVHFADGTQVSIYTPAVDAELEIWNYDPDVLAQDGCVNTLPLALSLKCNQDERVQQAVEEMMEEYPW